MLEQDSNNFFRNNTLEVQALAYVVQKYNMAHHARDVINPVVKKIKLDHHAHYFSRYEHQGLKEKEMAESWTLLHGYALEIVHDLDHTVGKLAPETKYLLYTLWSKLQKHHFTQGAQITSVLKGTGAIWALRCVCPIFTEIITTEPANAPYRSMLLNLGQTVLQAANELAHGRGHNGEQDAIAHQDAIAAELVDTMRAISEKLSHAAPKPSGQTTTPPNPHGKGTEQRGRVNLSQLPDLGLDSNSNVDDDLVLTLDKLPNGGQLGRKSPGTGGGRQSPGGGRQSPGGNTNNIGSNQIRRVSNGSTTPSNTNNLRKSGDKH